MDRDWNETVASKGRVGKGRKLTSHILRRSDKWVPNVRKELAQLLLQIRKNDGFLTEKMSE